MADPRSIRYIKAMRERCARISSQRVLCIDDNTYFRGFVRWFVSDFGCEVSAVCNAAEAIAQIQRNPNEFNLLILADWLPDMNGVDLVRRLRGMGYGGRIAVTAAKTVTPEQRSIYVSLGASSILMTPIGYAELMTLLQEVGDGVGGGARDKELSRTASSAHA